MIPKSKQQTSYPCIALPNIEKVPSVKILGVTFTPNLKWDSHITDMLKKCNSRLYALRILRNVIPHSLIMQTYNALIMSLLDYASPLFVSLPMPLELKLNQLTKRCHRIVHENDCKCSFENVNDRRIRNACKLFMSAEMNNSHPIQASSHQDCEDAINSV